MSVISVEKDFDSLSLILVAEFDAPIERARPSRPSPARPYALTMAARRRSICTGRRHVRAVRRKRRRKRPYSPAATPPALSPARGRRRLRRAGARSHVGRVPGVRRVIGSRVALASVQTQRCRSCCSPSTSSRHSSRSSTMCAGERPKPMHPMRPHSRRTTASPGRAVGALTFWPSAPRRVCSYRRPGDRSLRRRPAGRARSGCRRGRRAGSAGRRGR
jgi:hypothetical protein